MDRDDFAKEMAKMSWGTFTERLPELVLQDTEILDLLGQLYVDAYVDGYHCREDEEVMLKEAE